MELTAAIDALVIVIANAVNLLMVGIFLARLYGKERVERIIFGIPLLLLGVPLVGSVLENGILARAWWTIVLPLPLIGFLLVELALDYILKIEFRTTRLVGPYIGLYYVAFMLMVGYSFVAGGALGFITLGTYFGMLGATASYFARGSPIETAARRARVTRPH